MNLTNVGEKHGQEYESVCSPYENDAQVHAEVEDLEDLGLGEGEDHDAAELGQGDAGQHLEKKRGSCVSVLMKLKCHNAC